MKNVLVMEDECHLEMTIATLVYIYNVFFVFPFLPRDIYYICREYAYEWLSANSEELCYVGWLIPQFYNIIHTQLIKVLSQRLSRSKTEVNKKYSVPRIHIYTGHRVGIDFRSIITIGN